MDQGKLPMMKNRCVDVLTKCNLVNNFIFYCASCIMHSLSRAQQVAFEKNFGSKGVLGEKNILQFLHTIWSVQDAMGEQFHNDSLHGQEH